MSDQSSPAIAEFSDGLDDVEDFGCANEGESSMSWEKFGHVFELMQTGNQAYRRQLFDKAIDCYSKASSLKSGDPTILSNRSAAYIRMSRFLKSRPPVDSDDRPLSGLDPTVYAELALKDAEKAMNICSHSVKSYVLKVNALVLLERYQLARDVVLSGLHVDPLSNHMQVLLKSLDRVCTSSPGGANYGKPERTDDFDCTLCLKLLYEPITTPCGHSFCRSCLFQSMDRSNKCPLCRTVLFITPRTCAISVTLNNIIQKNFPEEYAERKEEQDRLANPGVDLIPLFVMDAVLPFQKLPLNIFEPRYRLMVRRIMEGNHRMGMVIPDPTTGHIADFACEVEITECEPLPDGRFYIEVHSWPIRHGTEASHWMASVEMYMQLCELVEGRRRFHIIRSWDQDGYRVAEVEWIKDTFPTEATTERADLRGLMSNASEFAQAWLNRAKEAARRDRSRLMELMHCEATIPTLEDPERFSFWLVTLPKLRPLDRLDLLRLRDTKERITRGLIFLRREERVCRLQ